MGGGGSTGSEGAVTPHANGPLRPALLRHAANPDKHIPNLPRPVSICLTASLALRAAQSREMEQPALEAVDSMTPLIFGSKKVGGCAGKCRALRAQMT